MTALEKAISKLPEAIREMVRMHIRTVMKFEVDQRIAWIEMILMRHYDGAYRMMIDKYSPDEKLFELDRVNDMTVAFNKENKNRLDQWRILFSALISLGMSRLSDKITK